MTPDAETDSPGAERVTIGRYLLERFPLAKPGTIYITCNEKSDACGEGGGFPEKLLEEAIGKFYAEHF